MSTREWDAGAYHRLADPMFAWGQRLLDTVALRGDETVLDAGCGTGRVTRLLLERLPRGRVIALDLSEQMLAMARANLEPDFRGRVEYLRSDLLELSLERTAELVFSTATFHWVPDHPRLFRNIFKALRPGGTLVAQFGGKGNLDRVRSRSERVMAEPAFRPYFDGWTGPWHYPDDQVTARRLEQAGFEDIGTQLFAEPTTLPDPATYRQYLSTVIFRLHLRRISDPARQEDFLDRAVESAAADDPPYTLDYWRLNVRGRRGQVS